uniref:Uncharacterized protein n=1 Tax=Oryza punctata TaxID=4537 RepID=A0A0E0JT14_ORYPU
MHEDLRGEHVVEAAAVLGKQVQVVLARHLVDEHLQLPRRVVLQHVAAALPCIHMATSMSIGANLRIKEEQVVQVRHRRRSSQETAIMAAFASIPEAATLRMRDHKGEGAERGKLWGRRERSEPIKHGGGGDLKLEAAIDANAMQYAIDDAVLSDGIENPSGGGEELAGRLLVSVSVSVPDILPCFCVVVVGAAAAKQDTASSSTATAAASAMAAHGLLLLPVPIGAALELPLISAHQEAADKMRSPLVMQN